MGLKSHRLFLLPKTEKREYVSCLNCKEEDAVSQFMEAKRLWKKTDGRLCYHGYQSFKADEVDAATAHQIGAALAMLLSASPKREM